MAEAMTPGQPAAATKTGTDDASGETQSPLMKALLKLKAERGLVPGGELTQADYDAGMKELSTIQDLQNSVRDLAPAPSYPQGRWVEPSSKGLWGMTSGNLDSMEYLIDTYHINPDNPVIQKGGPGYFIPDDLPTSEDHPLSRRAMNSSNVAKSERELNASQARLEDLKSQSNIVNAKYQPNGDEVYDVDYLNGTPMTRPRSLATDEQAMAEALRLRAAYPDKGNIPAPDWIIGSPAYYVFKYFAAPQEYRNGTGDDYLMNFGYKNIHKFYDLAQQPDTSPQLQDFDYRTGVKLQLKLEETLAADPRLVFNREKLLDAAYKSHPAAYEEGGFGKLIFDDQLKVARTPDWGDKFINHPILAGWVYAHSIHMVNPVPPQGLTLVPPF